MENGLVGQLVGKMLCRFSSIDTNSLKTVRSNTLTTYAAFVRTRTNSESTNNKQRNGIADINTCLQPEYFAT